MPVKQAKTVQQTIQPQTATMQPVSQPVQSQPINPKPAKPVEKEKAEIKTLGIFSMAKFNAIVLTFVGFVLVGVYTILTWLLNPILPGLATKMVSGGMTTLSSASPVPLDASAVTLPTMQIPQLTPVTAIVIIVLMALWGFISGAILAICYNIISKLIGGIEFTLQEK